MFHKKDKSVQDLINSAREDEYQKTKTECAKDTKYRLEEQKNRYELEIAGYKGTIYSQQLEIKRIRDKYEITSKREFNVRKAEKSFKFYADKVFEMMEEDHIMENDKYKNMLTLKDEIDNYSIGRKDQKLLEDRK